MAADSQCLFGEVYREPVAATFHHQKEILINQSLSVATLGSNLAELSIPNPLIQNHNRCIAVNMAGADEENMPSHSEEHEEEDDTVTAP